jgi:hypothetical protein
MSTDSDIRSELPDSSSVIQDARRKLVSERTGAVSLTEVGVRAQQWLWPARIPLGDVTLLAGDPGAGKGLLALDLAARVTRGALWPDEAPHGDKSRITATSNPQSEIPGTPWVPQSNAPGSVLLLTAEDSLAATIRPRLDEAGADCSRIVAVPMSVAMSSPFLRPEDSKKGFELRRDLQNLRDLAQVTPDCRLVVIDPINSYLSENSDRIRADDPGFLVRLVAIARENRLAVLIVTHLRKKGGRAVYCSLGSLAFVATARAVWAVTRDAESLHRRLLVPIKNNLAADASALAFTIESGPSGAAKIGWCPEPVDTIPDTVVSYSHRNGRPDDERQQAKLWLRERLASGPCAVKEIREEADANGFSRNTVSRAFRELNGKAVKKATADGPWLWQLPIEETQNPCGEFWVPSNSPVEFAHSGEVS